MFTTLRSKILAGFAAVIAINVVFGLWAIYQFSDVGGAATDAISSNYELITNTVQLSAIVDIQLGLLQQMPGATNPDLFATQFSQRSADFRILLVQLGQNHAADEKRPVIDSIGASYDRFLVASRKFIDVVRSPVKNDPLDILYREVNPAANALRQRNNRLYQNQLEITNVRRELSAELKQALYFVGAGTVIATFLGIIGGGFYSRWAIRPIERLTQAVKNLTGGQLGERILITTADELGDLSFEFNRMIERLRRYEAMNIEQLLLEKRKVETIVQSIATPIIVVDAEMRLLLINSAAVAMFRLPIQGVYEGREVIDLVRDEGVVHSLRNALERKADVESGAPDIYIVHEEGAERFYSVVALPLQTSSAVNGVVAVFSDITHFKELDRLKSEFLAKVSHEFRTPLSSIIMSLDILREGLVGEINADQLDLLNSSKDDCRRLSKLITDLLELSRMEAKLRNRTTVQIDLAEVIDSVLRPHRLPAKEKGVEFIERIAPGIPLLWASPEEFRWLFNNLISNALRHTDSGGSVTIAAAVDARNLVVSIEDTGHGIPMDSLSKIFEKFHQVGSPSVATPGSVGLGLAIAKDVVESYGGRISVSSEIHKGSCFTVKIPLERLAQPG
ncbi:MAG: ATP-binding protein [Candidatus Kapaibacterium sp.]